MLYVRLLSTSQRYSEALKQLEIVTQAEPNLAPAWLSLGALELELGHAEKADAALKRYLELVAAAPAASALGQGGDEGGEDDENEVVASNAGVTQAYLMLAQASEQRGDFTGAEQWLAKIENPQRAVDVQLRRAILLARQGQLDKGMQLIRALPEASPEEGRAKLVAQAQVLREVKQWREAYDLLGQASQRFPDDPDLLYEQAMMAEKLDRLDDMERLLRRVIEIKPTHHHAYNALGYSLADRNQRLPEARELIRKALELSPGEPFITDSLGWVEYRMGNRDEALRLLRQAYSARPDVEIAAHLGEVLWISGHHEEAKNVWRDARARDASNEVLRATLARLRVDDL
jgi:tetratricopeptide (TPR) repeat protein